MGNDLGQPANLKDGCPSVELLIRHVSQPSAMSPAEAEDILVHLVGCPDCGRLYDVLVAAVGESEAMVTSDDALAAKADFWRRVGAHALGDKQAHLRPFIYRIDKLGLVAAACLLLGLGTAICLLPRGAANAVEAKAPLVAGSSQPGNLTVFEKQDADQASPEPFDPAKIDYAKWRDDHKEWFAATFPWIFDVQKVLMKNGVQADYIELLVVSGDIWQFEYDPQQPLTAPLSRCYQTSLDRVARHYGVGLLGVTAGMGGRQPDPRCSLRLWREDIAKVAQTGSMLDSLLLSLRGCSYMAKTRTALWLWGRQDPLRFAVVLQESGAISMLVSRPEEWRLSELVDRSFAQVMASRRALAVAQEVGDPSSCPPLGADWRLIELLQSLAPPETGATTRQR